MRARAQGVGRRVGFAGGARSVNGRGRQQRTAVLNKAERAVWLSLRWSVRRSELVLSGVTPAQAGGKVSQA